MYIHHFYLPTFLIIQQPSSKNCVVKNDHLPHQLQQLPRQRHYLIITLKRQSNRDIHHSLKFYLLPPIYKSTSKYLTMNLNKREILFLPIQLLVPPRLPVTHLPLRHLHTSCKEVTYRVYSFVTTSQGYTDILSCDLNKHVSCLSEHVIIESHGIL